MDSKTWFELWDTTSPKFQWFIEKYYPNEWTSLEVNRRKGNQFGMLHIMNIIWFGLPDHLFNLKKNPQGWREFLNLIEE